MFFKQVAMKLRASMLKERLAYLLRRIRFRRIKIEKKDGEVSLRQRELRKKEHLGLKGFSTQYTVQMLNMIYDNFKRK